MQDVSLNPAKAGLNSLSKNSVRLIILRKLCDLTALERNPVKIFRRLVLRSYEYQHVSPE